MKRFASCALALAVAAVAPRSSAEEAWCTPETETLPNDVCYHAGKPSKDGRRTLVIFLHGLVADKSGWQHNQQLGMVRAGNQLGFSVIMPRGRKGSTGSAPDMISWPTSHAAQGRVEDSMVAEWLAARALVEKRDGAFDEVFVMGFSNGAYYATSLALRGRLEVDGYGLFAGGSGAAYHRNDAKRAERRRPIFVAIAGKDSTAKNGRQLRALLRELGWPHRAEERRVGHAVADAHLENALRYLRGTVKSKAEAPGDRDAPKPPRALGAE